MDADKTPTLYLIPVTLGGGDPRTVLPARNFEIMKHVRHFVVENTRSARRFIRACDPAADIGALSFAELNEHTPASDVPAMLAPMEEGLDMGCMSEAGCPAVADPGALLVAEAQRRGFRVVPLVGPSSIILALMASGFNGQCWAFEGYLPTDAAQRRARVRTMLQRIDREDRTEIFIETPYRNGALLKELCDILPPQVHLCVACDVTCPDESIRTMTVARWRQTSADAYRKRPAIFLLHR